MYSLIMKDLLKLMKISTDISITEKIRFILKDTTVSDDNYAAVCLLNSPIITKPKLPDLTQPVPIAKKVNPMSNKKSSVITKVTFEPSYPHKTMALTTFNEKVKIIAINNNFEKMLRNNIIDCTNKLFKLDSDKEGIVSELEENYSKFLEQLSNKLATVYKKEKLEMNLEAPVVNN